MPHMHTLCMSAQIGGGPRDHELQRLWQMTEMTRALLVCAVAAIAPAPAVGVRMPPGVGSSVRRAPPRSMAVAAPPELSRAEQKERRVKTGQHLKRLAFLSSDPPPDACAVGMRELETMGAEGLAVNVNAHNQAMCLCSGEPAVEGGRDRREGGLMPASTCQWGGGGGGA